MCKLSLLSSKHCLGNRSVWRKKKDGKLPTVHILSSRKCKRLTFSFKYVPEQTGILWTENSKNKWKKISNTFQEQHRISLRSLTSQVEMPEISMPTFLHSSRILHPQTLLSFQKFPSNYQVYQCRIWREMHLENEKQQYCWKGAQKFPINPIKRSDDFASRRSHPSLQWCEGEVKRNVQS